MSRVVSDSVLRYAEFIIAHVHDSFAHDEHQDFMDPNHKSTLFTLILLYIVSFFLVCAQKPDVKVSYFANLPTRLFFLDDTTVSAFLS